MINDHRPNPDQLLTHVQAEEARSRRGKLKIFLGYVAGVGKTYAMLQAAHQRRQEGVDVVVGYVETHGRAETDALVAGLEVVPRKQVDYRGVSLTEMDVDAVLARRPQLALVDELAHTNVPGSRHTKRYQDIEDLLDAGIDIYSTLNVQHLESLNDVVAQITGTIVRETVPDRILQEANEIELIDLPIDELRQRLHEGKVYVPEQAARATEKFFRPGNLTALRELAFRQAAVRVDDQMRAYMQTHSIPGPWPAGERLLVCISPSPLSERLVRTGRRLATELNAEWEAVYVDRATPGLSEADRDRVARTLRLAESLGAKIVTLPGQSVAESIASYARANNITKIIAGKPLLPRWREWLRGSLVDQLIRQSHGIDVYVMSNAGDALPETGRMTKRQPLPRIWRHYLLGTLLVALVTLLALPIRPFIDPTNLVMVYLLTVVIAAVRWERRVAAWVSLVGVLAFDVFFVPPYHTIVVADAEYILTFVGLFIVGIVISTLAAQARDQAQAALRRENQTSALYDLSRDLAGAVDLPAIVNTVTHHVSRTLGGMALLWFPEGEKLVPHSGAEATVVNVDESGVADWVFRHKQPAGRGTDTLPGAARYHLPLLQSESALGVMSVAFQNDDGAPTREQLRLLESFANQTTLAVDRIQLAEKARQAQVLRETERLQNAILNSISHDLRTPLTSITGALSSLRDDRAYLNEAAKSDLVDTALDEAERMNRLVNNLLDMSRLESGTVKLVREPSDVEDLVGVVLAQLGNRLRHHPVALDLPDDLPLIPMDFVLMAQVLVNVVENAAKYSPAESTIEISARIESGTLRLQVRDRGIGIPAEALPRVFEKFYRVQAGDKSVGSGLGLSISKTIVEAHGGIIWIEAHPDGGTIVNIELPLHTEPT